MIRFPNLAVPAGTPVVAGVFQMLRSLAPHLPTDAADPVDEAYLLRVKRYVCECCAPRMSLVGYRFTVSRLSPRDDDGSRDAVVSVTTRRAVAAMWIPAHFRAMPDECRRHAIIHELCHLYMAWPQEVFDSLIEGLPPASAAPFTRLHDSAIESAVDRMAVVVSATVPTMDEFELGVVGVGARLSGREQIEAGGEGSGEAGAIAPQEGRQKGRKAARKAARKEPRATQGCEAVARAQGREEASEADALFGAHHPHPADSHQRR